MEALIIHARVPGGLSGEVTAIEWNNFLREAGIKQIAEEEGGCGLLENVGSGDNGKEMPRNRWKVESKLFLVGIYMS